MKFARKFISVAAAATILLTQSSVLFAAESKEDKVQTSETAETTLAETTAETSETAGSSGSSETSGTSGTSGSSGSSETGESSSETTKLKTAAISSDGKTFKTIYGSQLPTYLNHQYTYNGKLIPISESNYWFINSFNIISQYAVNYGMYPVTVENFVDLNTEFQPEDNLPTLGDYLVDYAEKTLTSIYASLDRAQAEGMTLSDDYQKRVDEIISDISINKSSAEGLTIESYLELYYGPGCTMDVFKQILTNYYLSEQYAVKYCEKYQHKPEDAKVPNVRYVLFYAPEGSSEEDLKKAETLANDLKTKAVDLDTLKKLGDEAAAKKDGEEGKARETGDFITPKGATVPAFDSWAWDPARKEGDIDVIKSEEYGYFVVGYLGLTDNDPAELQNIAVDALQAEIFSKVDSGEIKLSVSEPYGKPKEVALATPTPGDQATDVSEHKSETSGSESSEAPAESSSDGSAKPEEKVEGGISRKTIIIASGCLGAVIVIILIVIIASKKSSGKEEKAEKVLPEQAAPGKSDESDKFDKKETKPEDNPEDTPESEPGDKEEE